MPAEVSRLLGEAYINRARDLGVELEERPRQRVFITGLAQRGPLGDTFQTSEALYAGIPGTKYFPANNWRTNIAGPLPEDYDPFARLHPNDDTKRDGVTKLQAMAIEASREALRMAGLLDEKTGLIPSPPYNPDRMAAWVGSGVADTPFVAIDTHNTIHHTKVRKKGDNGEEIRDSIGRPVYRTLSPIEGSRRISPKAVLPLFPEEFNARVAVAVGLSGWGGSPFQACASGASGVVEGARIIHEGIADVVVAGGGEDGLLTHKEMTVGAFAAFRGALSNWNDRPEKASRPFDKDRTGFVPSSGFGGLILESEEHLRRRGGKAYAELVGFRNSMDGKDRNKASQVMTELNPKRVAKTIFDAIRTEEGDDFYQPDAAFMHATSTQLGDKAEAKAIEMVFGEKLRFIPVTALKSMLGHLLGGAGAANIVNAVIAMMEDRMPRIANLDNPDPEIAKLGLEFVRGENLYLPLNYVLALAYGFGGYNSIVLLRKAPADLAADPIDFQTYKNRMLQQAA